MQMRCNPSDKGLTINGQNQRYVRLPIRNCTASAVVVDVPPSPNVFPGQYHLFLVSRKGVPSWSRNVVVNQQATRCTLASQELAVLGCSCSVDWRSRSRVHHEYSADMQG
jgi:hypothetical protein